MSVSELGVGDGNGDGNGDGDGEHCLRRHCQPIFVGTYVGICVRICQGICHMRNRSLESSTISKKLLVY